MGVGVSFVAWSSVGRQLAICGKKGSGWLHDVGTGDVRAVSGRPDRELIGLAWSRDASLIAGGFFGDPVVFVWNADTGRFSRRLEGHQGDLKAVSFSADGTLLASKAADDTVRLWRLDTGDLVSVLQEPTSRRWPPSLAFHPREPIIATLGENDKVLRLWRISVLSEAAEREREWLQSVAAVHHRLTILEKRLTEWIIIRTDCLHNVQSRRHLREGFLQRHLMMVASRKRLYDETYNRENLLNPDMTVELSIHLNAYYLNLSGALDNLAWLLAYELELKNDIDEGSRDHRNFSRLFSRPFLAALEPKGSDLAARLQKHADWNREVKRLRDPAAHRIPLYMPPGIQTEEVAAQRQILTDQMLEASRRGDSSEAVSLQYQIWNLATYVPGMITSDATGIQLHSVADQLAKDQQIFLAIAQTVFVALLGTYRSALYWTAIGESQTE